MLPDLKQIWFTLCSKYTSNAELMETLYKELYRKYTGSGRHYHNLQHIRELIGLAEQYEQYLHDKDGVQFSIFYHDIIYNVLRKDNEQRSAVRAVKRLTELGVPASRVEAVGLFIEATKTHQVPETAPGKTDLTLFLDFDMAILAAPWEAYSTYTGQVRREYRIYPDRLYKPGRKAFLQQTLQTTHIFHTAVFREQYEARARANMEKELQAYI